MSTLAMPIRLIWACSIFCQVCMLVVLLLKKNLRKLPFFSIFAILNICQAGFILVLYSPLLNLGDATTTELAWDSQVVTLFAQALATLEALSATLKPYKGIWGLGWRALALTSGVVFVAVVLSTRDWASAQWFLFNRAYHLVFATALIACLLLIRYYSVPVASTYKIVLGGFAFYSSTEVLTNTILQALFYRQYAHYGAVWQFTSVLSFLIAQVVWIIALWRPLPVEDRKLAVSSSTVYRQLSPEINEHLRLLDEKLMRLWKREARSR